MNHEKLNYIAQNPAEISAEDARELEELTRNFPYFSLPFALLTRYYAVHNDYRYEDTLHKTALRVHDRGWLFELVHPKTSNLVASEPIPAHQEVVSPSEETTDATTEEPAPQAEIVKLPEEETIPETHNEAIEVLLTEEPLPESEVIETANADINEENISEIDLQTEEIVISPAELVVEKAEAIPVELETEEEIEEFDLLPRAERIFEPDAHDLLKQEEDAVFEEIEMFDSQPVEIEAPELLAEDPEELELMAELELSGAMVQPDTLDGIDEAPVATPKAPKMPMAGSVYSIEDYFTPNDPASDEPPSDFFSWLNKPTYSEDEKPIEAPPQNDKKTQLINQFISNPASISRPKAEFFNASDMAKKSEIFPDDMVTETLAGVYLKQENFSGALRIYEKLVLKFPEKSTYFAALIEKIKKEHHL